LSQNVDLTANHPVNWYFPTLDAVTNPLWSVESSPIQPFGWQLHWLNPIVTTRDSGLAEET
jgi:hypothetical protein